MFNQALTEFSSRFKSDRTYTLILRLRHCVIKTGIGLISLSYSRISFADMARKLQLDDAQEAEYISAKVLPLLYLEFVPPAVFVAFLFPFFFFLSFFFLSFFLLLTFTRLSVMVSLTQPSTTSKAS